jgi:two-component system, OmpR family, osmolarity sensor histidine kinase EnvZ
VAAAFNRMAGDLQTMERERAMVLAGISHDLRTPLSRLRLALEMTSESENTEGMIADIEEIDAVIGQFLDFARGENEAKAAGDPAEVAAEVAEHYTRIGSNVTLSARSVPQVRFARMAVRRAITNLVDNALRYAGEPIEIRTAPCAGGAVIEVLDRGPGIPEAEAERLKRPFTRLDSARSGRGGSGLGLAIVERVARAHGGTLKLQPRRGGGLAARFELHG